MNLKVGSGILDVSVLRDGTGLIIGLLMYKSHEIQLLIPKRLLKFI